MNVAIVIATCGSQGWADLAWSRAYPSTRAQTNQLGEYAQVVIEHYPDLGVAAARNAAAEHADRDWLCFLDADDELEAGYVEAIHGTAAYRTSVRPFVAADEEPAPLLVPAVRYVDHTASEIGGRVAGIPNLGRWPEMSECVVGTLIKADAFRSLGGFREETTDGTTLSIYEDYDLFLRAFDAGARLVHCPGAVYRAYSAPEGRRGRNQGSDGRRVYDAIWRDHVDRTRRPAKDV